MSLRFIVRNERGEERELSFEGPIVSIGRSAENHLPIDDLNSSRHHCEVHALSRGHELLDHGSRNGTFLNGRRVTRSVIAPGDAIEIGTTVIYFQRRPGEGGKTAAGRETLDITTGLHEAIRRSDGRHHDGGRGSTVDLMARYERDLDKMRRLLRLNKILNSELSLKPLLEIVLDTVISIAGAERGFLLLAEDGRATIKASRNIDKEAVRDAKDKISRSISKEVLASGQPVLIADAAEDGRFSGRESIRQLQLRSVLSVPLKHRERILGALYLDNRFESGRFSDNTLEIVEIVADQAAIAIENARLFGENERQRGQLEAHQEELLRLNNLLRDRLEERDADLAAARAELAKARGRADLAHDYAAIVSRSPKVMEILAIIDKIVDSDVAVLIQGESGTGKELIARALHDFSPRSQQTFVSENCAAIPQHLMESTFFGHVRGAFTGAVADKIGLFELADGGTLFLDEIGDMDLDLQTKLLRVLQDGILRPIGSKDSRRVNVRIVSATNKDLRALIGQGLFREDLFYRLNVINLKLPPLRERPEDIAPLTEHFLQLQGRKRGEEVRSIEAGALELLEAYTWPGNIRELENEIERALALAEGAIRPTDLSPAVRAARRQRGATAARRRLGGRKLKEAVAREIEAVEIELITAALQENGYKKSRAAKDLGVSRPTLDSKIEKYELTRERVLGPENEKR